MHAKIYKAHIANIYVATPIDILITFLKVLFGCHTPFMALIFSLCIKATSVTEIHEYILAWV